MLICIIVKKEHISAHTPLGVSMTFFTGQDSGVTHSSAMIARGNLGQQVKIRVERSLLLWLLVRLPAEPLLIVVSFHFLSEANLAFFFFFI